MGSFWNSIHFILRDLPSLPHPVEFKIGSTRVTHHEPLTITSTATPVECLSSVTSSAASQGVVEFSNVQFSGFIGWCTFVFHAYFNAVGNPSANSAANPSIQKRLVSSIVSIISPLPDHSLVGGSSYFFSGLLTLPINGACYFLFVS
jgi:hypothetical protein